VLRFTITDYQIRSTKIYKWTIFSFCIILISLLIAEVIFDLRSTTLEILAPLTAFAVLTMLLSLKYSDAKILRAVPSVLLYAIIEIHFLINPTIFHAINYWLPFIPLIALIIQGIRASQIWIIIIVSTYFFNYYFLGKLIGDSYTLTIQRAPFLITGIVFTAGIIAVTFLLYVLLGDAYSKMIEKNNELEILKSKIEKKKDLLERYQQDLINLSKDESVFNQGQERLFKAVCRATAKTLKVNRVSIWLFENQNSYLVRKALYELENESDEMVVLERKDYPTYFEAVETRPFILATDARVHLATREFTEGYLKPLSIYSMLDCPIIIDRKPFGVICCENQREVKEWNTEDALFIQSLADLISMNFKNERIKTLLVEIRRKNNELTDKNNEILTMNEELSSLNEELSTVNETLEETVRFRTKELETQNEQLTEYAFINSHLLRAPLARILGLSDLLTRETTSVKDTQLIEALYASSKEMDIIIKKISDILYDGKTLTREDIKTIIDRNLNQ